ncbi:MAG: class I SAM-dependent methyltransferase [Gemmatimonadota bacterium]
MGSLDLREILSFSAMYRLFSTLIGSQGLHTECVEKYVRPHKGDRVLDCGCGPGVFVDFLPEVEYVGIDMDEAHIDSARSRFGDRAIFRLGPVDHSTMREKGHYDLVLAGGLLHHLDDRQLSDFLTLARGCLKETGRLVTIDGCYTDDQSAGARRLLDRDRGMFVRHLDRYLELVRPVFPGVHAHVRHNLLRIPSTHLIMECPAAGIQLPD